MKFAVPFGVSDPQPQYLSSFGSGFLASLMLRGAQAVQKLVAPTQVRCQPWTFGAPFWVPGDIPCAIWSLLGSLLASLILNFLLS